MRHVENLQRQFGQVGIEHIQLDPKLRDDIPSLLRGLQHLYKTKRTELLALLDHNILPQADRRNGRPGMDLLKILVLGMVKQGGGYGYDHLLELANEHQMLRLMLGHGWAERERYERQNLIDNVSLLTPALLREVNQMIVSSGHAVVRKKPGTHLAGRIDSFVVETAVHYPTDVNQLWDAVRCALRESARAAKAHGVAGWRQSRHLTETLRRCFQTVSTTRRQTPERVAAYLAYCGQLRAKVEGLLASLPTGAWERERVAGYHAFAVKLMDQVGRRLLKGETIPHGEKIFSVFEPHTRWVMKGKAGKSVELGVPVCVCTDQYGFILNHEVMWTTGDVDVAVPFTAATQAQYPEMVACSYDRGFHSPENRRQLDLLLDLNALPKKGRRNAAEQAREEGEAFVAARRQHPGVESAINHLEHCGLDRVHTHGAVGFERSVALSIVSANLKRLGQRLQVRERKRLARSSRWRRAA